MRFLRRVIEIVRRKDIDWIEVFLGWIATGFCVALLAPGDYFADNPRLRSLERIGIGGIVLPELFWLAVFGLLSLAAVVAIAAGERPLVLPLPPAPRRVTRQGVVWGVSRRLLVSPYVVRMRVLAVSVGVWGAVLVLALPSAQRWRGVPVSLTTWLFLGMAGFALTGALRMAAEVSRSRDAARREAVMEEAMKLAALFREMDAIQDAGAVQDAGGGQETRPGTDTADAAGGTGHGTRV